MTLWSIAHTETVTSAMAAGAVKTRRSERLRAAELPSPSDVSPQLARARLIAAKPCAHTPRSRGDQNSHGSAPLGFWKARLRPRRAECQLFTAQKIRIRN